MTLFNHCEFDHHERVHFVHDRASGLKAIIAIHNTRLGPAVGGCRMFPYVNDADALTDVLRLSRGMTFKSALANLPFGGGKSVIIGDPRHQKTPALLQALAKAVHELNGTYVIAEDSGTSPEDMREMARITPYVAGIEDNAAKGDPSPATAYGVYLGMKAAAKHRYGSDVLTGKTIAIQGLGHVGYALAKLLHAEGAVLIGYDTHQANLERCVTEFGLIATTQDAILTTSCDIFSPCALGAVLNSETIPRLQADIVAGAANNQLATAEDDDRLAERGILYCPDFAINAGGIIEVHHQRLGSPADARRESLVNLRNTVAHILEKALLSRWGTQRAAIAVAEDLLRHRGHTAQPTEDAANDGQADWREVAG